MKRIFLTQNKTQRVFFVLSAFVLSSQNIFALSLPSGGGTPPCGGIFGPCIPIDGGISFLLIAGGVYGSKKAFEAWKANK